MFIMNFKEIHSNTEFLSTYRRARACSCRNKIKNTFIEKRLECNVQASFGTFRLLLGGSTHVQLPLAKYEIYLTFSKSPSVFLSSLKIVGGDYQSPVFYFIASFIDLT